MFMLQRGPKPGQGFLVLSDPSLFEDVLTFDDIYGNPQTPNMSVTKTIFQVSEEQLEEYEDTAIKQLRRLLLRQSGNLANDIADKVGPYLQRYLGEEGVMDLQDLGTAVFWPMTQALFGEDVNRETCPHMRGAFDKIDNEFGKALKGRKVPLVEEGVAEARVVFENLIDQAKGGGEGGQCPAGGKAKGGKTMGPLLEFYDGLSGGKDKELTGKFATAAWWGGQGNTIPATVWTFGLILANEEARRRAYEEVDQQFADQPDEKGNYDFDRLEYLSASLREALRLKTYSIAWRLVKKDHVMTSSSGNTYAIKKGTLVGKRRGGWGG